MISVFLTLVFLIMMTPLWYEHFWKMLYKSICLFLSLFIGAWKCCTIMFRSGVVADFLVFFMGFLMVLLWSFKVGNLSYVYFVESVQFLSLCKARSKCVLKFLRSYISIRRSSIFYIYDWFILWGRVIRKEKHTICSVINKPQVFKEITLHCCLYYKSLFSSSIQASRRIQYNLFENKEEMYEHWQPDSSGSKYIKWGSISHLIYNLHHGYILDIGC